MSVAADSDRRVPTPRQFDTLYMLGAGSALLTGRRRDVEPLLRRGWVTARHGYGWVRITAAGLHALARAVEKYGLPEFSRGHLAVKVCSECARPWKPRCRCGSSTYRVTSEEVAEP